MSRLKVLLISFFIVFVLFALLAFFTGSSLFWSVFKAFISACLVAVFLFVANFFLLKYVPDFFEDKTKEEVLDTNVVGANLDIRIDDASHPSFEHDGVTDGNATMSAPKAKTSFEGLGSQDLDGSLQGDSLMKEETTQEEQTLSSGFKPLSFSNEKGEEGSSVNVEKSALEGSEAVRVDDAELSEAELSETIESDVDRLEELPDLQEFVDTSNLKEEQTRGDELMSTGTQSFFATDLSDDVTDSNLMAKAVRTVLKRDV